MSLVLLAGSARAQDFVPGEVIVKFRPGAKASAVLNRPSFAQSLSLKRRWNSMGMEHYAVHNREVRAVVSELQADPDVEYAEPNYYLRKTDVEPGVTTQSYTQAEVQSLIGGSTGFSMTGAGIQATQAWDALPSSGTSAIVAIIDTGVDLSHPALQDALWINPNEVPNNGIDDDRNGYIDDVNGWNFAARSNRPQDGDGHGTHVAGIIRGVTQDIFAAQLGSPRVKLMVLKFLDDRGVGTTSDAIASIYYAVYNGARVLNNSWGGGGYSRSLLDAIAFAYDHRALFVAAAGNSGTNNDAAPLYPSSYDVPNIVAVAATNDWDNLAGFSNYGRNVHLSAPGVSILSTYPSGLYTYLSGTSMATPFVSGIAALMAYERPDMTGYQMKNLLLQTVDVRNQLNGKVFSSGRVNAAQAVNVAQSVALSYDQPVYVPMGSDGRGPASSSAKSGCGTVARYYNDYSQQNDGTHGPAGVLLLLVVPLLVWFGLRKSTPQRRFERFEMPGRLVATVGGQKFEADLSTISLGGLAFSSDAKLESGSIITMTVASPDGAETCQVSGRVVWTRNHDYGVSFEQLNDEVRETLRRWSAKLVKLS